MDISGRSWDVHLRSSSWAKSNRCQQSGRRERQVDTDRRGGNHVTPETGTVMSWPTHLEVLTATSNWKRQRKNSAQEPQCEHGSADF